MYSIFIIGLKEFKMKNIGVIGGGLIGASWAAIFSKSGFNVFVYDPYPDVFETYESRVLSFLE